MDLLHLPLNDTLCVSVTSTDRNVLVVGGAGTGKSALLAAWADTADAAGVPVLRLGHADDTAAVLHAGVREGTLVLLDGLPEEATAPLRALLEGGGCYVVGATYQIPVHGHPLRDRATHRVVLGRLPREIECLMLGEFTAPGVQVGQSYVQYRNPAGLVRR